MANRHTEKILRSRVLKRDGAVCRICGKDEELTLDHIIPLSLGGSRWSLANIRVLCKKCNEKRGNDIRFEDFLLYIENKKILQEKRKLLDKSEGMYYITDMKGSNNAEQ
jgi:5-methylcytosine-specific restriction endonuclease McrA